MLAAVIARSEATKQSRRQHNKKVNMCEQKQNYVYILFNRKNGTLYTGVTSNLIKRIYEHKHKTHAGFTSNYSINKLGYYEIHSDITSAIAREKQIKGGSRKKKIALIESMNPEWNDLYETIF